jgi:hypothetical protein
MQKKAQYILFILVLTIFYGCEKEEVVLTIDPELQPYFDSFQEEALKRGRNIQFENFQITASIQEINRQSVAGQCTQAEGTINQILIDQRYWRGYTPLLREALVFHELGHCILKRSHRDDKDLNGNCVSLMESGGGNCTMHYHIGNRDFFLDELFSE